MVHYCCLEEEKTTFQNDFFDFWSAHEAPIAELFHLSNLLQTQNDCRMADVEFFGNLTCNYKRIRFNDGSQLIAVNF